MSERRLLAALAALALVAATALALACSSGGAGDALPELDRVALVRGQALSVRTASGEERELLRIDNNRPPLSFPVWSPDGTRIAVVLSSPPRADTSADWGDDIYTLAAGGGKPELLWKHRRAGEQVQGFAWTADGKALLVGYGLTVIENGKFAGRVQQLQRIELASGQATVIAQDARVPSISADGTRIAYLKDGGQGRYGLAVANADGSAERAVPLPPDLVPVQFPRIAPDGASIVFAAPSPPAKAQPVPGGWREALAALLPLWPRRAQAHGVPQDLWRVSLPDGPVVRLTGLSEDEPRPAWIDGGRRIVMIATGGLYELNADGSGLRRVADGAFGGQIDAWSARR